MTHPNSIVFSHVELTLAEGTKLNISPAAEPFVSAVHARELIAVADDGTVYRNLIDFVFVDVAGGRHRLADRPHWDHRTPNNTLPVEIWQDEAERMAPYVARIAARKAAASA